MNKEMVQKIAEFTGAYKIDGDTVILYVPDDDPSEVCEDAREWAEMIEKEFPNIEVYERWSDHDTIQLSVKFKVLPALQCPR